MGWAARRGEAERASGLKVAGLDRARARERRATEETWEAVRRYKAAGSGAEAVRLHRVVASAVRELTEARKAREELERAAGVYAAPEEGRLESDGQREGSTLHRPEIGGSGTREQGSRCGGTPSGHAPPSGGLRDDPASSSYAEEGR